jgi:Polyketide cyclase / dehydrase and lipid transport
MSKIVVSALATLAASTDALAQAPVIAAGTNHAFYHEVTTSAPPNAVWAVWTDVAGWGRWDKGLKSASLDGPFVTGARGTLTPLSGPNARFVVREVRQGESYRFTTALPFASLSVTRTIVSSGVSSGQNASTVFRHDVRFDGLLGGFWAKRYGPGFRAALPPTMVGISTLAQANAQ